MKCKNCSELTAGAFCHHCGQASQVARLTIFAVLNDFCAAILNTEKGILRTAIDLFLRPGEMVFNYIEGKRIIYFSAGKYLLLMVVLFSFSLGLLEQHFSMFETLSKAIQEIDVGDIKSKGSGSQGRFTIAPSDKNGNENLIIDLPTTKGSVRKEMTPKQLRSYAIGLIPEYHRIFFDYLRLFSVGWVPIFALLSYFFFRKEPLNLAEHFIMNAYFFAQALSIFVLLCPLFWIFPQVNGATSQLVMGAPLVYLFFAYVDFFKKRVGYISKTIGTLALGLFSYGCLLLSSTIVLALIIAYQHMLQQ